MSFRAACPRNGPPARLQAQLNQLTQLCPIRLMEEILHHQKLLKSLPSYCLTLVGEICHQRKNWMIEILQRRRGFERSTLKRGCGVRVTACCARAKFLPTTVLRCGDKSRFVTFQTLFPCNENAAAQQNCFVYGSCFVFRVSPNAAGCPRACDINLAQLNLCI